MNIDPGDTHDFEGTEGEPSPTPAGRIEYRPESAVHTRAALLVQAGHVEISKGAALGVISDEADISMGYSSVVAARELNLERGGAQWLLAGEAHIQQGGAGIVVARQVEATDLRVGVLLAGNVNGNVQAVLDRDAATRFGAALGVTLGIALLIRRLMH